MIQPFDNGSHSRAGGRFPAVVRDLLLPAHVLHRIASLLLFSGLVAAATSSPREAHAGGSYFLLEADTGFAESAYDGGDPGIYYGFRSGLTWKPKGSPIRFHLLMGAGLRNSQLLGAQAGLIYAAEQYDLDLYVSTRVVVPVFGVRLYAEVGAGDRLSFQSLTRDPSLGGLSVSSDQFLLLTAIGAQVRLTENISAGLRVEMNPLAVDSTLISHITGYAPTHLRMSGIIHVGLHF